MKKLNQQTRQLMASQRRRCRQAFAGILVLLVGILALGCSQGAYPLDIFYEMHYQPSYKEHEPPRLSAPASAVPFFEAPKATNRGLDAEHLYNTNCAMCHGVAGKGDGPALVTMMETYGYNPTVPADLTALDNPLMIARDTAGVTSIMVGGLSVMPSFSRLLSAEEIDAVADYVVNCLQEQNTQLCR